MDTIFQDLILKIGENQTPINKFSSEAKKELRSTLQQFVNTKSHIPDELLLRTLLTINDPVNSELKAVKTITNALSLKDILKYSEKLSQKETIVNGKDFLESIREVTTGTKHNLRNVQPIINCITKWINTSKGKFTEKTEKSILEVIKAISSSIPTPKNLDNKTIFKYKKLLAPLIETSLNLAANSSYFEIYFLSISIINSIAKKFPSLIVNEILSNDQLFDNIARLNRNIAISIEHYILNNDTESFSQLYRHIKEASFLDRESVEIIINDIWESKGAILNSKTQSTLKSILFDEPIIQNEFEIVDGESKSSLSQLATALISSWEARNDGPRAKDSFSLLSSVAEKYFNLKLGGKIEEVTNFNKLAHELPNNIKLNENAEVIILRPWVEQENYQGKTILIKSIVKPKQQRKE